MSDINLRMKAASSDDEKHQPGMLSKIASKIEGAIDSVLGGHNTIEERETKQSESSVEKIDTAQKLDKKSEVILEETDLYTHIQQENLDDLASAADKLEYCQSHVREELDQLRFILKENQGGCNYAAEQIRSSERKLQQTADLIDRILTDNENVMKNVADKLELAAKKLRMEVNRLKAEELTRAATELKMKAEILQSTAEQTKVETKTLEQKTSETKQQHQGTTATTTETQTKESIHQPEQQSSRFGEQISEERGHGQVVIMPTKADIPASIPQQLHSQPEGQYHEDAPGRKKPAEHQQEIKINQQSHKSQK